MITTKLCKGALSLVILIGLSAAQAAGVKNFDIPARAAGSAAVPTCGKACPNCPTSGLRACKKLESGELPDQPIVHDPRIKAAVIIDPYPVFVFADDGLSGISAAVQLWSSDPAQSADGLSGCCAAAISQRLPVKAERHVVPNAKHFSFLATCTPKEAEATPAICTDPPGFDRLDFHRKLHADVVAFFRRQFAEPAPR